MKCDICGKEPALIHIEGVGNFCLDCHNERMAALCGLDHDPFEYPRDIDEELIPVKRPQDQEDING